MRYEWDERKRLTNLEKHGLDSVDVGVVSELPYIVAPSAHDSEERFICIGTLDGRFVTVVYAMRGKVIRIISFRRARHEERKVYQKLYGSRT